MAFSRKKWQQPGNFSPLREKQYLKSLRTFSCSKTGLDRSKVNQSDSHSSSTTNLMRRRGGHPPVGVICVDTGEVFESINAAARHVGGDRNNMSKAIKRGTFRAGAAQCLPLELFR
eukprot:g49787.t1